MTKSPPLIKKNNDSYYYNVMVVRNGNIGHAAISFPEIYTDK